MSDNDCGGGGGDFGGGSSYDGGTSNCDTSSSNTDYSHSTFSHDTGHTFSHEAPSHTPAHPPVSGYAHTLPYIAPVCLPTDTPSPAKQPECLTPMGNDEWEALRYNLYPPNASTTSRSAYYQPISGADTRRDRPPKRISPTPDWSKPASSVRPAPFRELAGQPFQELEEQRRTETQRRKDVEERWRQEVIAKQKAAKEEAAASGVRLYWSPFEVILLCVLSCVAGVLLFMSIRSC